MRDDPKLGVQVRYVYPKSPADAAGIKAGDRIVKYGVPGKATGFKRVKRGRDELAEFLNAQTPQTAVELEVQGKDGKARPAVKVVLEAMPGSVPGKDTNDVVPATLPEAASLKKALDPLENGDPNVKPPKIDPVDKKYETGLIKRVSAAGDRKYWIWVDADFDPQIAHGVVVLLHQPGKFTDNDVDTLVDTWRDAAKKDHLILVGPITEQEAGWTPNDADLVLEAVRDVTGRYTIDKNRVVAFGSGNGGQMAFNLAFKARDLFRGSATHGAVITTVPDSVAQQRLMLYVAGGDRDPIIQAIRDSRDRLVNTRYPVFFRVFAKQGREDLDEPSYAELFRWIDTLDRL